MPTIDDTNAAIRLARETWNDLDPSTIAKLRLPDAHLDTTGLMPQFEELVGDRLRFRFAPVGNYEGGEWVATWPMVLRLDPSGWVVESLGVHDTGPGLSSLTWEIRPDRPED